MAYSPEVFGYTLLGENQSVNLNASAPTDFSLPVSHECFPRLVLLSHLDAAAALATLGLYSATGGGGDEILAPTTLSGLTAAGKCTLLSLNPFADQIDAGTLYLRLTAAAGSAATCQARLYGFNLDQ